MIFVFFVCFHFFIFFFILVFVFFFFFSSRRRHTRCYRDWSSDVCSSDLGGSLRSTSDGAAAGMAFGAKQRERGEAAMAVLGTAIRRQPHPGKREPVPLAVSFGVDHPARERSEERRVGKECRCGGAQQPRS